MPYKNDDYKIVRMWTKTHHTLKLLAALYHESLIELLDRLAEEEMQRAKDRGEITATTGRTKEVIEE